MVRIAGYCRSGQGVGSLFVGDRLVPVVGDVGLGIEVFDYRLGEGSPCERAVGILLLGVILVHEGIGRGPRLVVDVCRRVVVAEDGVAVDAVTAHHGKGAARDAEFLTEEGEAARGQVTVVAGIELAAVVGLDRVAGCCSKGIGVCSIALGEAAAAEIQTGLENERGVLREFVFHPHPEAVAVGTGNAVAVGLVDEV